MSQITFQVHKAASGRPTRLFVCHDDGDVNSWECPTTLILTQYANPKLIADLRTAADELEATMAKDAKEAEIKARVKAAMEAEGVE